MGRLNTVNRPTLWTKHTDYLTLNGVPGELSNETLSKKTLANRKHSDDLNRIEAAYMRDMKTLTSDKRAMEDSMLVYSEKMKRISRERMSTVSASPPLIRSDAFSKEKSPSCTKLDEISDRNILADTKGSQSPRLRSSSDVSCYSNLRGQYVSKRKKKISLDMTAKGGHGSELTVLTPSPDGAETSDSGIESPKLGTIRQRRHGVTNGPKQSGKIPEGQTSVVLSASNKPRNIRHLPLIQNFQSNVEQDALCLGHISEHSLDFDNVSQENIENMSDGDRLFRIYGKRWNKHPRTDPEEFFNRARQSKRKPLIKRSESLEEYDIRQMKHSSVSVPEWQPTVPKYTLSTLEHSDTFQVAMQCLSLSEAETSKIGANLEFCETDPNFDRKIRDISSDELQLLVAQRERRASLSSTNSPVEYSDVDEENTYVITHPNPSPVQPLKSVLKKQSSTHNLSPDSQQKKSVSFKSQDEITLIFREPEEDITETPSGNCSQSESTIVIVSQ